MVFFSLKSHSLLMYNERNIKSCRNVIFSLLISQIVSFFYLQQKELIRLPLNVNFSPARTVRFSPADLLGILAVVDGCGQYIAISVQPPNLNVDVIDKQEIIKPFIYICCLLQIVDDLSLRLLFLYILTVFEDKIQKKSKLISNELEQTANIYERF